MNNYNLLSPNYVWVRGGVQRGGTQGFDEQKGKMRSFYGTGLWSFISGGCYERPGVLVSGM